MTGGLIHLLSAVYSTDYSERPRASGTEHYMVITAWVSCTSLLNTNKDTIHNLVRATGASSFG